MRRRACDAIEGVRKDCAKANRAAKRGPLHATSRRGPGSDLRAPGRGRPQVGALIFALGAVALLAAWPGAAQASVNTGQLFVKTDDAAGLEAAVEAWLVRYAARDDVDQDPLWVRREGGRRVVVLPPQSGWALVLEGADILADRALARHLAESLETETVWIEVAGNRLGWRFEHRRGARRLGRGAEPAAVFDESPGDLIMPAYADVEQRAWDWLEERGVPAAYRMLNTADLQRAPDEDGDAVKAALFRVARDGEGFGVTRRPASVRLPERGESPPVVVDTILPGTGGPEAGDPGQAIDLMRLVGTPSEARIDHLAKTLAGIRARYTADGRRFCHLVEDPYRIPVYTRLARDEGPCQGLYERMLERARDEASDDGPRHRPMRPPSRP